MHICQEARVIKLQTNKVAGRGQSGPRNPRRRSIHSDRSLRVEAAQRPGAALSWLAAAHARQASRAAARALEVSSIRDGSTIHEVQGTTRVGGPGKQGPEADGCGEDGVF